MGWSFGVVSKRPLWYSKNSSRIPLYYLLHLYFYTLVAQRLKHLPAMWETWVRSLGWEDPLEKEMATHSSILAWRIPWMEEPGGLQFMGLQRVGHNWVTSLTHSLTHSLNPFWVNFCEGYRVCVYFFCPFFSFFLHVMPDFITWFVEKTLFSHLVYFCFFVTISWLYLCGSVSNSLFCSTNHLSILLTILHCLD